MVDTVVDCPQGVWTMVTASDVTGDISVEILTDEEVYVKSTTDTTTPTATRGFSLIGKGDGWSQVTLAEILPGVAGVRLWVFPIFGPAEVAVSYT